MSREGSLDLLQEVEESLDIMRQTQHIKACKSQSYFGKLTKFLRVSLANDTYDKYISPSSNDERPKIYFPYRKKEFIDKFFSKTLKINPPSSSPLYKIFTSIQDYHTGESWLEMMCNLTNEVKAQTTNPLKRREFC